MTTTMITTTPNKIFQDESIYLVPLKKLCKIERKQHDKWLNTHTHLWMLVIAPILSFILVIISSNSISYSGANIKDPDWTESSLATILYAYVKNDNSNIDPKKNGTRVTKMTIISPAKFAKYKDALRRGKRILTTRTPVVTTNISLAFPWCLPFSQLKVTINLINKYMFTHSK